MNYLKTVAEAGVKNMEMEALVFGALTHMAGIRSAVVCVTLLDRLKGDQVTSTAQWETWGGGRGHGSPALEMYLFILLLLQITTPKEELLAWQTRPMEVVAK